jgi:choline-sulfatase
MSRGSPNVLVLLSGQHNPRFVGRAEGLVETPTLDRLAETGATFDRAYTPAPSAGPARGALLTGRTVENCRVWDDRSPLRPGITTLPESFSAAGYRTALVGTMHLDGDRQFLGFDERPYGDFTGTGGRQFDPLPNPKARGSPAAAKFDATGGQYGHRYDPQSPDRRSPDPWRSLTADAGVSGVPESQRQERTVLAESLAVLRDHDHDHPDRPWLLCASFSRPSYPLTAPARHVDRHPPDSLPSPRTGRTDADAGHPLVEAKARTTATADFRDPETVDPTDESVVRRTRAAYAACVSYLDELLGDFLALLDREGFLENTIVVYASDRGNLLGEHRLWWDGTWHEDATRVPWVVQTPDHRADGSGTDISTPVSLVDLYPTLCGLADVDAPADLNGVDLSGAVRGDGEPDRGPVFVDQFTPRWGNGTEFRAVRDGRYKYVRFRDAPDRLFDLDADPRERTDRSGEASGTADRLRGLVDGTLDFEATLGRRDRDRESRRERALSTSLGTTGNAYLLGDRRLVDADTTLYRPSEIAKDASRVLDDWDNGP